MPFSFELQATCPETGARAGLFHTPHGPVETPRFMPVGTAGTVKALAPRTLRDLGTQVLLGNTYHLALRPGRETLRAVGGLHRFMAWDGPILTDSGGFQVFSLAGRRDVTEDGVTFRSHLTGDRLHFSPESVVDTQRDIGSDVMMVLDELTPATVDRAEARRANARTVRWAGRGGPRTSGRPSPATGTTRPSSRLSRAPSTPTSAARAPTRSSPSTRPATPSAGSRSARRRR